MRFRRRGTKVINQTPRVQEIENPANGSNISNNGLTSLGEGNFAGGGLSKTMNNRVSVVLVNPRSFGSWPFLEKFGKIPYLTFMNIFPRKPPGIAGNEDDVRRTWGGENGEFKMWIAVVRWRCCYWWIIITTVAIICTRSIRHHRHLVPCQPPPPPPFFPFSNFSHSLLFSSLFFIFSSQWGYFALFYRTKD